MKNGKVLGGVRARVAVVGSVSGVLVVVLIALIGGSASATTQQLGHATSARASIALEKGYAILRRAHVASTAPDAVQRELSQVAGRAPQLGLDANAMQEVPFGEAGSVWIEPGSQGMCAFLDTITLDPMTGKDFTFSPYGCEQTATALTDGVVSAMTVGSQHFVWGVVPSGNAQVRATFPSGDSQLIPVTNNAFFVETATAPQWLSFKGAAGSSTTTPVGPDH